jgi:hypothetical protein
VVDSVSLLVLSIRGARQRLGVLQGPSWLVYVDLAFDLCLICTIPWCNGYRIPMLHPRSMVPDVSIDRSWVGIPVET